MDLIQLNTFGAITPRVTPRLLPAIGAQTAENCDLSLATLQGFDGLGAKTALSNSGALRSIYKLGDDWLAWAATVDVVKAQILDSDERLFFTGDGYPKQTTETLAISGTDPAPDATRRLGVTPPSTPLTVNIYGAGDGTVGDVYSYVYTYVCRWTNSGDETIQDEESSPSPPTSVTTLEGGQYISLEGFVIPTLLASGNNVTHIRVYRLVGEGDGEASYQLLALRSTADGAYLSTDIPVASVPLVTTELYDVNDDEDGLSDAEAAEVCPSITWLPPPEDSTAGTYLTGLVQWQNGILAGIYANQVCLSEPFVPYAWPVAYRYTLDDTVRALGVYRGALIVGTDSFPYVLDGVSPDTVQATRLAFNEPCVSARGMTSTPFGVLYPSDNGLMFCDGVSLINLTRGVYTPGQWDALSPNTLIGMYRDGVYYGFFSGTDTGIMVDFAGALSSGEPPRVVTLDFGVTVYGGHVCPADNTIYLLTYSSEAYGVQAWEGASTSLTYTWKSKVFVVSGPVLYACARVVGEQSESSPVTFQLWADGVSVFQTSVTSSNMFRLPSNFSRATRWEFELSGTAVVYQVSIARDAGELLHAQ